MQYNEEDEAARRDRMDAVMDGLQRAVTDQNMDRELRSSCV